MAKIISQETYDEVLKENIVEFSMEVNEAREETIKQFELTVCRMKVKVFLLCHTFFKNLFRESIWRI